VASAKSGCGIESNSKLSKKLQRIQAYSLQFARTVAWPSQMAAVSVEKSPDNIANPVGKSSLWLIHSAGTHPVRIRLITEDLLVRL
jgi:hypothetical protein